MIDGAVVTLPAQRTLRNTTCVCLDLYYQTLEKNPAGIGGDGRCPAGQVARTVSGVLQINLQIQSMQCVMIYCLNRDLLVYLYADVPVSLQMYVWPMKVVRCLVFTCR